jgi:hypothetical protein
MFKLSTKVMLTVDSGTPDPVAKQLRWAMADHLLKTPFFKNAGSELEIEVCDSRGETLTLMNYTSADA